MSAAPSAAGLPREQSRWLMRAARTPARAMGWACAAPLLAGALLVVQAWLLASLLGGVVEVVFGGGDVAFRGG